MTRQRRAILECLQKAKRPLSIEEILVEVAKDVPSLNLSTLYRNLKILIEEKDVQSHDLPGSCTRYAILDSAHTHHFLCQQCNRLFNIHFCPKEIFSMIPPGFTMHSHFITLTGSCHDCNILR